MSVRLLIGDCRDRLQDMPDASVQCVVTSPPYFGLRDYGVNGQIGAEPTPQEFVAALTEVFREVWRVLRDDGTVWLNLGDSYARQGGRGEQGATSQRKGRSNVGAQERRATSTRPPDGLKQKDLIGIPWRVAFALQEAGWYLRQDIIWSKTNPMPESVRDRCTKAHEYLFMLSKSPRYYYDASAIAEPALQPTGDPLCSSGRGSQHKQSAIGQNGGYRSTLGANSGLDTRNKRSVWQIATQPYRGAHFATFPPALVEQCIKAGSAVGDTVLDPFAGSGTTGYVADYLQRDAVLIDLNAEYAPLIRERLEGGGALFSTLEVVD